MSTGIQSADTELIHVGNEHQQPTGALAEFRAAMFSMPVPQMQAALAEYDERRDAFRAWLLSKLVRGVHFGYVPGTVPKWCDEKGRPCDESVAVGTSGKNGVTPFSQWKPKPSLYKAGADLICDTLGVRDDYMADMETWEQLGKPAGTMVRKCVLSARADGRIIGYGTGARLNGQKGGDANNSVKMADKCAKVAAVLNTYGLSDLFTQDGDTPQQPLHPNPDPKPDAPKAQPRDERVTTAQVKALADRYKMYAKCCSFTPTLDTWAAYVLQHVGRNFAVSKPDEWTVTDAKSVDNALKLDGN